MTAPSAPPSLPSTAVRLLALCSDGSDSLTDLVGVIEADPGISGRLLRLANSPYYGFSRKIGTLATAVRALGKVSVQAVALGHSILTLWEGKPPPPQVEALWVHAYRCALGCRHVGQRVLRDPHFSDPDTLFLTGLLHDIGKIFFLLRDPASYTHVLAGEPGTNALLDWERARFGLDHAQSGGDALEAWALPPTLASVVRYHHRTGLRAELQADWAVLRAVDELAAGRAPDEGESPLPQGLLSDLAPRMECFEGEARDFYRAFQ